MTKRIQRPRLKSGPPLGTPPPNKLPSELPELAGKHFGKLTVVSGEIIREIDGVKCRPKILTECNCGIRSLKDYSALIAGQLGCRKCGHPERFPRWLWQRCAQAQQRCQNPEDKNYHRYGARGIEFRFASPSEMALWVQKHLGLHKDLTLDRIENDKHYEAGNIRYANNQIQANNQRGPRPTAEAHAFLIAHPEIHYSHEHLKRLIRQGLTWREIIDRHAGLNGGQGPTGPYNGKLKYSTSLTPDPAIALLRRDS